MMPLPVLRQHALTSADDLLRQYQRTERLWADHLGEAEQLAAGVAVTNPELPNVHDANRLLEAALPPGQGPDEALEDVRRHFDERSVRCWSWQFSVSRERGGLRPPCPQGESSDLATFLEAKGYVKTVDDVMALTAPSDGLSGRAGEDARAPRAGENPPAFRVPPGVTILPTRAALRQARELAGESDTPGEPTLAEARMLHLDDPHCDSLLAMRDGRAVGRVTVLAVGEIGRIDELYVSNTARRQGIGRLLISRAMEICARSLFKHVMLSVDPANAPAITLYQRFGFRRIGELQNYRQP